MKRHIMKKLLVFALACAPLCASAQSLIITLQSGESVKYPISNITSMSFEEAQPPVIDEDYIQLTAFTDPVLQAAVATADADNDGQLSAAEIATITSLDLKNSEVASLEGIQYLTELTSLNLQSCTKLTALDLSVGLDKLEFLQVGFCSNLETLTLGNKPALKEIYAQYSGLTDIDLSGTPALETISLASTNIENISITNNTSLQKFTAGGSTLKSVDLTGCTNVTSISLPYVSNFSSFDISQFPLLESFEMSDSKVTRFTTEGNPELKSLILDYNGDLSYLDVSKSLKLSYLSCYSCYELYTVIMTEGQSIPSMYGISDWCISYVEREYPEDVAAELTDETFRAAMIAAADTDNDGKISADEAKALTVLDLSGKSLSSVDFTYFGNLTELNLSNNSLESVDLSSLGKLKKLNVSNNQLTALDVERLGELEYLDASNNQIATLSSFGTYGLLEVNLANNKLTAVKIYYQGSLTKVDVSNNEITNAEIRNNNALTDLDVSHNNISSMTMWTLAALKNVKFNDNPFTQLDDSTNWVVLETIDCSNTDITTLDLHATTALSKCTATGCANLTTIYVGENANAEIVKDDAATVVYGSPAN